MTKYPWKYPLIGILDRVQTQDLVAFPDERGLTELEPTAFRDGSLNNMRLFDGKGGGWRIVKITDLGRRKPRNLLEWIFQLLLKHKVSLEFIELEHTYFDALKEEVCARIEAQPDDWLDEDLAVGGGRAKPMPIEKQISRRLARVRKARTMGKLIELLSLEPPYGKGKG